MCSSSGSSWVEETEADVHEGGEFRVFDLLHHDASRLHSTSFDNALFSGEDQKDDLAARCCGLDVGKSFVFELAVDGADLEYTESSSPSDSICEQRKARSAYCSQTKPLAWLALSFGGQERKDHGMFPARGDDR